MIAQLILLLAMSAPPAAATTAAPNDALALAPAQCREALKTQLAAAGDNREELLAALRESPAAERGAMAFLLANMPARDAKSLQKNFLLHQVAYACQARAEVPWGAALPEEVFRNGVLPYVSVNERRDDWRKDFMDRFLGLAKKCQTPGEAALVLNKEAFRQLDVKYHATKRPKPDQSPYESTAVKYASCTGLSILIVDACRACAIPARLAGTPLWTNKSGNHSWAEVWDGRQWRFIGSAESTELDKGWFNDIAAKADPDPKKPQHWIYATSFAPTKVSFPMVWAPWDRTVPAENVTLFYTARRPVAFSILDAAGKPAPARLTLRLAGHVVAADQGHSSYSFILAGGQAYEAQLQPAGQEKVTTRQVNVPASGDAPIELRL